MKAVVDASVAIKWVVPEIHHEAALSLIAMWDADGVEVIVPSWFAREIANVLYQRVRRGDLNGPDAQLAIRAIMTKVYVRDVNWSFGLRSLELAAAFGLKASYDTYYLALAEHLDCELWTADDHFWNVVKTTFPWVKWIGEAEILPIVSQPQSPT